MKTTKEMIAEQTLWAGLNRPEAPLEETDIVIFGIPFDGGVSFRSGAMEAPQALRSITYSIAPATEHFEDLSNMIVKDLGDFEAPTREALFQTVEDQVFELVKAGSFFTMIGGDHSTTIPVQRGINRALSEPFGIIHIDAHFDLCDTLEGDSLSHGSTERRALELSNVAGVENLSFIGIRSAELDELEFLKSHPVQVISAARFEEMGVKAVIETVKKQMAPFKHVYITVDIDCLDPAYAAGTGTPQFGGLHSRDLLTLLRGIFDLPVIGFDVVEIAPKLDPSLTALFAGRKILTECWGHHWRKKITNKRQMPEHSQR